MKSIKLWMAFISCILPLAGYAHDGHGVFEGFSLAHYLASPAHLIPTLAGAAIVVYIIYKKVAASKSN